LVIELLTISEGVKMGKDKFLQEHNLLNSVGDIILSLSDNPTMENQYQLADLALNIISDGIYLIDKELKIVYVNQAACDSLGYTKEELIGKTPYDIDPLITVEKMNRMINSTDEMGRVSHETKHRRKDGTVFDVQISTYSYVHEMISLNIAKDLTAQKKSDDMIRMLTYAVNTSSDSVFLIDTEDASIFYVNDTAANILGYTKNELTGGMSLFNIDPDFNDMEINKKFVNELETRGGAVFQVKHRTKEGRIYPVEVRSSLVEYENKKYVIAISHDISESKESEQKTKLLASVFTHAKEGIVITDNEANIIDVNETYTQITGYSKEELLGNNTRILKSDKHEKEFYKNMWNELIQNQYWIGEIWNRRKDGELFLERLTISAITDSDGNISSYVGLQTDITILKDYECKLEQMAYYDALTGLPNRVLFAEKINQAIAISKRLGDVIAVCYLDLDGFKPINDEFGHTSGDELLIEIANRMQKIVRESDTVARIGGDEFALLLVNIKSKQGCEKIIKKLLKRINEQYILSNGMSVSVSASVGIILYPLNNSTSDALLRHADQAMYVAKESGKNRYIFYTH
jgi:diguanylate cyclase (GGDEF)-like protein/PAS domain S-box-containing protein